MILLSDILVVGEPSLRIKNLSIVAGDQIAFISDDQASLTNLLRLIAGKQQPATGKVHLARDMKISWLDQSFQSGINVSGLFAYHQQRYESSFKNYGRTAKEYLSDQFIPIGTTDSKSVAHLSARKYNEQSLLKIAEELNADHLLNRRIISLSSGESKKIQILKSLTYDPDLIVMDQPYEGLDQSSRNELSSIIDNLTESGVQVVISINKIENLPKSINRLIICEKGKVVSDECAPFENGTIALSISENQHESATKKSRQKETINSESDAIICLDEVSVSYNNTKVLDQITWHITKGQKWRISGPNGSGKTTLLSMISGDHPQSYAQNIRWWGHRRGPDLSIWQMKKRIAQVSPEVYAYLDKSQQVKLHLQGSFIDDKGPITKMSNQNTTHLINTATKTEIDSILKRSFYDLSIDQIKRVLLCKALLNEPEVLILDEITQGLQHQERVNMLRLIESISQSHPDLTILYVSHYDSEIISVIDHELILDHGRIIEIKHLGKGVEGA